MTTNTTIKSLDKIKLLDEMLEDLAGEELNEYNASATGFSSDLRQFVTSADLSDIDNIH